MHDDNGRDLSDVEWEDYLMYRALHVSTYIHTYIYIYAAVSVVENVAHKNTWFIEY